MNTAVILAARKEHDSLTPYPLMPFDGGQCLVERTIGILRELKFTNILLVVGYCEEMFQRFVAADVSLVSNPNYQFTASMGSLAMAAPYINEDFLVIEGDVFYEKKLLEQLVRTVYDNCLTITEESGNGDEAFVETKNGFVTKISKDRHCMGKFEGEMIGVTKLSLEKFRLMMELWRKSNNPYVNYEYLFFDVTEPIDRPYILFPNLIWGEVDNARDFERLHNYIAPKLRRKENPFDPENLRAHLRTIFPSRNVDEARITSIGGMSNKNFKVELGGDEYVLRVPGNGAEGMVERRNEEINSMLGCRMAINPEILYFNNRTGIKLATFVRNAETLNAATVQRTNNMQKIVRILRTLHCSRVRLNNEFNIFHEIEKYENLLEGGEMYEGWQPVRNAVMGLQGYLNELGVSLKPCHNDLVAENFIKDEEGAIYLIDWEYSGMNDPMADFAALFIESDFSNDNADFMLYAYFDGGIPAHTKEKIVVYQILWDYLWTVWTVIKEAKGDNFGTYGHDRFDRAINNLKKIERL